MPSKMMLRAAGLVSDARRAANTAGSVSVSPDWSLVAKRIRREATDDWDDHVAVERFESKGRRFVRGWGRLDGPGRVTVGERTIEASRGIVVNTGTEPWSSPIPGLAELDYWTNREAIETTEVPSSLLILGGGAVGVELGRVFSRFGSEVTIIEAGPRLLPPEEPESGKLLEEVLSGEGMRIITGAEVRSARRDGAKFVLELASGEQVAGERLLVAAGRRADLAAVAVGSVGLDERACSIPIDDKCRAAPGLWAMGDVTGVGAFTHISMYHADIVVAELLGLPIAPAEYRAVPRVTFTDPEIGSVGLNERAAVPAGVNVRTAFSELPSSTRGWIQKVDNAGFIKLVEDTDRGVLLGATSAGRCAGEVLSMLTLAVHSSIPVSELTTMIYAYPTFHRAVAAAVRALLS